MTIKGSGSPLSMSEINAEFGLGNSLSSYRGATWWTDAGTTGTFSQSPSFSEFYGKRKAGPSITAYFTVVGGGGGGGSGTFDNIGGGGGGGGGGGVNYGSFNFQYGTSATAVIGAGGEGGYYYDVSYDPENGIISSWIRATNGSESSLVYGSNSWRATGGKFGYSRYYWNGNTIQEATTYKGGDSGTSITNGVYGTTNAGGVYNTAGTSGYNNGGGGGGGGGVDDATNDSGYGGAGGSTWYGNYFAGVYGGGGGGGGDYEGGAQGGTGGGGGHNRPSKLAYAGEAGTGGGGGGGDSWGGGSQRAGAAGGRGRLMMATIGNVNRLNIVNSSTGVSGWDSTVYVQSVDLYLYVKTLTGNYTITCPAV